MNTSHVTSKLPVGNIPVVLTLRRTDTTLAHDIQKAEKLGGCVSSEEGERSLHDAASLGVMDTAVPYAMMAVVRPDPQRPPPVVERDSYVYKNI